MRCHLTTVRMTIIYMASVGKNVKKLEHLCTVSGSIKLMQLLHKTVWIVLSKLKIEQPCGACNHVLQYSVTESCPTLL